MNYELKDIFNLGKVILKSKIESEIIIRETLNYTKEDFHLNLNKKIDKETYKKILENFNLRKEGMPLSYITNKKYFLDNEFIVIKGVFIPRFETEEIVYHLIKKSFIFENALDICCGTGVIGISLLLYGFARNCTFVDISDKALENTTLNLEKFKIDKSLYKIVKSDMFENINSKFDIIISNPPYIKLEEYENLPEDVKKEPINSLISGSDGLNHIKILINESKNYLSKNGILVFEYEKDQYKLFKNILNDYRILEIIKTYSDNIEGIILGKL